jgi:hypothetical protein
MTIIAGKQYLYTEYSSNKTCIVEATGRYTTNYSKPFFNSIARTVYKYEVIDVDTKKPIAFAIEESLQLIHDKLESEVPKLLHEIYNIVWDKKHYFCTGTPVNVPLLAKLDRLNEILKFKPE